MMTTDVMCALLRAGSPIDSPVRRRSLSPRSRSRTPPRGGSAQQMHWKKKLDALFDRGVVRSSELDDRTLDALDGADSRQRVSRLHYVAHW